MTDKLKMIHWTFPQHSLSIKDCKTTIEGKKKIQQNLKMLRSKHWWKMTRETRNEKVKMLISHQNLPWSLRSKMTVGPKTMI